MSDLQRVHSPSCHPKILQLDRLVYRLCVIRLGQGSFLSVFAHRRRKHLLGVFVVHSEGRIREKKIFLIKKACLVVSLPSASR